VTIRRRPTTVPGMLSDDPVLDYALRELAWFEWTRDRARRWHQGIELGSILAGAATVVSAGLRAPAPVTACIAGLIVFLGGVRQLFDHGERYVVAAEAWSRLNPAVERYRLLPETERDAEAKRLLRERVEEVTETEHREWASRRRRLNAAPRPGPAPAEQQLPAG
jgi:hypothetical protein